MIPFVVSVDGQPGVWVLDVDPVGERILTVNPKTKELTWRAMADCRFVRILKPDEPIPVILVQPAGAKIVAPTGVDFKRNGG